MPLNPTTNYIM